MSIARPIAVAAGVLPLLFASVAPAGQIAPPRLAELPEIPIERFLAAKSDPRLLIVEFRDDVAIAGAPVEGTILPGDIRRDVVAAGCIAVFVADAATDMPAFAATIAELQTAGCELHRLAGDAEAWVAAGIARPRGHRRPGEIPFVVPRGLCEQDEPAQVFE